MIRINVFMAVEEANKQQVLDAAKALTEGSVKEEGCIAYDIFESATRANVLMICETWKDQASLDAHSKTEHYTTHVPTLHKLAQVKVEKLEM